MNHRAGWKDTVRLNLHLKADTRRLRLDDRPLADVIAQFPGRGNSDQPPMPVGIHEEFLVEGMAEQIFGQDNILPTIVNERIPLPFPEPLP